MEYKCKNCDSIIEPNLLDIKKRDLECGKTKNIFCNHRCSAIFNNALRNNKRKCLICNNFTIKHKKFCSIECRRIGRLNLILERVNLEGKLPDGTAQSTIRSFLLKSRPRKCAICGLDNWFGRPLPVVADHINGNPFDHRLENLRLVCGNCNMELPTNTGKNRGNGRYSRRQRYKDEKSY